MTKKEAERALDALVKEYEKQSVITITFGSGSKLGRDAQLKAAVRTELSLPEKSRFVDQTAAGCFAEDQYIPEYLHVMKKLSFYQIFTDLPLPTLASAQEEGNNEEKPLQIDLQKVYDRCQALSLVEKACAASPKVKALYDELCLCVDQQVAFMKNLLLSQERQQLNTITAQLVEMTEQMKDAATSTASALEGMDTDQLLKIASKLGESL